MFANRLPVKRTNPKTALAISGANKSVFGGNLAEGRTSSATYIDGTGVLQTAAANVPVWENGGLRHEGAATNLCFWAEDLRNTADAGSARLWSYGAITLAADNINAPDGAQTADKIIENGANSIHTMFTGNLNGTTSGATYTTSIFAKRNGRDQQITYNSVGYGAAQYVNFDLVNTALGTVTGGVATIADINNASWKKLSFSAVASATSAVGNGFTFAGINATDAARAPSYQGDSASGAYAWGAQIETGAYATSYIPTTTAAVTRATCALSIPLVLNTNFYQRSAILMRVRAKWANSATAKSWLTASTTAEGLIDSGSGALTFKDSAANTATSDLTSWAADTIILVAIVTDNITGLMSLSASKDNGVTWITSTDTAFAGLTVGANWLFFSANTQVFETLGFKVKKSNKGFAQMKSWALSHVLSETQ